MFKWEQFGVLNKNGDQIHATGCFGLWKSSILNWLSDTEIEKAKKDRDTADAPKCSIKSQPNTLGKLLWFTGKKHMYIKFLKIRKISFLPSAYLMHVPY